VADEAQMQADAEAAECRVMSKALVLGVLLREEVQQVRLMAERERFRLAARQPP
jgi:hypothetical protein